MRNDTSIFRLLIMGIFLAVGLQSVFGQVSYQVSHHPLAGNPGNKNQETDFNTTGWNTLLGGSQLTNVWSNPGNIPFGFQFFGQPVTFFRASANGQLTFDMSSTTPAGNNGSLPHPAVPDSTILCFWEAFTTTPPTGSNDRVETKLFGAAPYRQLWIRWHSFEWGPCSFAYVAIVLEETTNKVYVVDLFSSTNANLVTATVGIQANPSFAIPAATNVPLSAAGSANNDNSYYEFTPYLIEPYDMNAIAIESPVGDACGLGMENVTITFSNVGLFNATGMKAKLAVDGGSYSTFQNIPGTLAPGDTMTYTFPIQANLTAIGDHRLDVVLDVAGDNNHSNDSLSASVKNLISISTYPYQENFENGTGGWTPGGTNSSWEMGYANNPTIQGAASGVNTWITGRTGSYNSNENSWVMGPCFDLTNVGPNPVIAMDVWWESEYSWDGAVLQSSTDAGQTWQRVGAYGDPDNWYNDNTINSLPGNQQHGWSGNNAAGKSSNGWVTSQASLGNNLIGEPQVLFRVAFASDGSSNLDGFAFDNVTIGSAPVVDLGQDGFFCQGDQLDVGAENYSHTILWSTGATSPKLTLQNSTQNAIIDSTIWVEVTNNMGLVSRDTIVMSMTRPPTVLINGVTKVACFGDASGAIDISMQGGASPFVYSWSNGATQQDPTGLPVGSYTGQVTDINGCKALIPSITVTQNAKLIPSVTVLSVQCHGDSNAVAIAKANGGVGPYQYLWENGVAEDSLSAIPAGTYQFVVTDSKGCTDSLAVEITEPEPLSIDSTQATDANCIDAADGSIEVNLAGGTAPYSFFWDHGSTAEFPDSLAVGVYSGYALDSNQCFIQLPEFVIGYRDSIPEAGFGYGMAGAQVGFKDSSARAGTYLWDFGDGTTSTDPQPSHLYTTNGLFLVTQIVSNACGTDTITKEINILSASAADELTGGISVYPNPTDGLLTIETSEQWRGSGELLLFNSHGQLVWSQKMTWQPSVSTDIWLPERLARGLYQLTLKTDQQVVVRKLELR